MKNSSFNFKTSAETTEELIQNYPEEMFCFTVENWFPNKEKVGICIPHYLCINEISALVEFEVSSDDGFPAMATGLLNIFPERKMGIMFYLTGIPPEDTPIKKEAIDKFLDASYAIDVIPAFDAISCYTTSGVVMRVISKYFLVFQDFPEATYPTIVGIRTLYPTQEGWWIPR